MFKSVKTARPHEGNLKAKRIENYGAQCFVCLFQTFGACIYRG